MGTKVEILSDIPDCPHPELSQPISRACEAATAISGVEAEVEFACLLTKGPKMRKLNREFRGVDQETDVLAFPREEGHPGGDIAIAVDHARMNAEAADVPVHEEVSYLAVHAALHLLGYDHDNDADYRSMRAAEDRALTVMGLAPRPNSDDLS